MIRTTGTALVLVAVLSLVACGGGGDDEDASGDAGTTAAATASAAPATTPAAAPTAAATAGGSGSGGGDAALSFFTSAECRNTTLAMAQALSFASPTGTAAGEDPFEVLADALDAARDAAPDDIKNDLETLAAGFAAFATAIEDAGGWNPASGQLPPPAVMQALESLDTPEFTTAGDNVTAWFEENCGG
jgi:hypothetical protein